MIVPSRPRETSVPLEVKEKFRGCAGVLSDPAGQLNGADVIALPVVGAALGDQHDPRLLGCPTAWTPRISCRQVSLVPGKEDGKRGERDVSGVILADLGKCLAVGDDHAGRLPIPSRSGQLRIPDHQCAGPAVPATSRMVCCWGRISRPLGAALSMGTTSTTKSPGSRADRRDKGPPGASLLSRQGSDLLLQLMDVQAGESAHPQGVIFFCHMQTLTDLFSLSSGTASTADRPCSRPAIGDFLILMRESSSSSWPCPEGRWHRPPGWPGRSCSVPGGSFSPAVPQGSLVVNSRGVDDLTGPRGSSSMACNTGSVVVPFTSDTMARSWPVKALTTLDLPALRRPKKANVYPLAGGGGVQTHSSPRFSLSCSLVSQKRKSRSPCSIFTRRSAGQSPGPSPWGLADVGLLPAMTFSPSARVSGAA